MYLIKLGNLVLGKEELTVSEVKARENEGFTLISLK